MQTALIAIATQVIGAALVALITHLVHHYTTKATGTPAPQAA